MDPRFKQFEKLINRVLVPKINNLFSQYEDYPTRIIKVEVQEPKKNIVDPSIFEFILEQVKITFVYRNRPYSFDGGITAQINYLTLGLSSYIFTNTVVLYIKHKFGKEEVEAVFESSGYRRSESEAWEFLEKKLSQNYKKKEDGD